MPRFQQVMPVHLAIERLKEHREKTSKLKRWLLWRLFTRDFCPYCNKVTKWEYWRNPQVFVDDPPVVFGYTCTKCGCDTGAECPALGAFHNGEGWIPHDE